MAFFSPLTVLRLGLQLSIRLLGPEPAARLLAWACARETRELPGSDEGDNGHGSGDKDRKKDRKEDRKQGTIFCLSPVRTLADAQILAISGRYRVLLASDRYQFSLPNLFFDKKSPAADKFRPADDSDAQATHKKYDAFLDIFIRRLLERTGADLVLGANFWYTQDVKWGEAANRQGFPYVVIFKECLKTQPSELRFMQSRISLLKELDCSALILHNEKIRDFFVQSGLVDEARAHSFGAIRMTTYLRRLQALVRSSGNPGPIGGGFSARESYDIKTLVQGSDFRSPVLASVQPAIQPVTVTRAEKRQQVALFSFSQGISLNGILDHEWSPPWPKNAYLGWVRLFEGAHGLLARLAVNRPDVDFVMKPKWEGQGLKAIEQAVEAQNLQLKNIPNLRLVNDNAQDIILESDVVISFASTVMLEAALADKPVIVPDFDEAQDPFYRPHIKLQDYYAGFDVATTREAYTVLIEGYLDAVEPYHPPEDKKAVYLKAFEDWVSPLEPISEELHFALFDRLIAQGRKKRRV